MINSSVNKQDFKNENIQVIIRISFAIIIMIHLSYIYLTGTWDHEYTYFQIMAVLSFIFISNLFYKLFLTTHPFFFQKQRIVLSAIFDVLVTSYALYLGSAIAAYYPGVLLWFIIGYSMRYGFKLGFVVYFSVIFSWITLIYFSSFWQQHHSVAIGWLLSYIIIPLYFFKMLNQLHQIIDQLHNDVDDSLYKAGHDPLTKLPNRFLFEQTLQKHVMDYITHKQKFALFFIDLDGFKQINDIYGHHIGDDILIEVANKILSINPHTFRLGGDEFVSIVKYNQQEELVSCANSLIKNLRKQYKENNLLLSASIGIACYSSDISTYELKKYADKSMYKAKLKGKDNYCFYEDVQE
jgi:diguanylate cyclase (GGDEF)-like protein